MVKNLPAVWETQVWSLDWEDPLEKGMATHSGILALRIPWTEEPGRLQSMGLQRVRHDWATNTHFQEAKAVIQKGAGDDLSKAIEPKTIELTLLLESLINKVMLF